MEALESGAYGPCSLFTPTVGHTAKSINLGISAPIERHICANCGKQTAIEERPVRSWRDGIWYDVIQRRCHRGEASWRSGGQFCRHVEIVSRIPVDPQPAPPMLPGNARNPATGPCPAASGGGDGTLQHLRNIRATGATEMPSKCISRNEAIPKEDETMPRGGNHGSRSWTDQQGCEAVRLVMVDGISQVEACRRAGIPPGSFQNCSKMFAAEIEAEMTPEASADFSAPSDHTDDEVAEKLMVAAAQRAPNLVSMENGPARIVHREPELPSAIPPTVDEIPPAASEVVHQVPEPEPVMLECYHCWGLVSQSSICDGCGKPACLDHARVCGPKILCLECATPAKVPATQPEIRFLPEQAPEQAVEILRTIPADRFVRLRRETQAHIEALLMAEVL